MKRFFVTHPFMKLFSLGLAFFLWFFVQGERRIERAINVKLEVVNQPENLIITHDVDPTINVRIMGPKTRMGRVGERYFRPYQLDLRDVRPGLNTFWVHAEDFAVPYGVQVTRIVPQVIRIHLEKAEERIVAIQTQFVGEPAQGFEIVGHEIEPSHIRIRGSRDQLSKITTIMTDPIHIAGKRESFEEQSVVRFQSFEPRGIEEKQVRVRVILQSKEATKLR